MLGNNYRMTDINATIGIEQLKKINKNLIKNKISKIYNDAFKKSSQYSNTIFALLRFPT